MKKESLKKLQQQKVFNPLKRNQMLEVHLNNNKNKEDNNNNRSHNRINNSKNNNNSNKNLNKIRDNSQIKVEKRRGSTINTREALVIVNECLMIHT